MPLLLSLWLLAATLSVFDGVNSSSSSRAMAESSSSSRAARRTHAPSVPGRRRPSSTSSATDDDDDKGTGVAAEPPVSSSNEETNSSSSSSRRTSVIEQTESTVSVPLVRSDTSAAAAMDGGGGGESDDEQPGDLSSDDEDEESTYSIDPSSIWMSLQTTTTTPESSTRIPMANPDNKEDTKRAEAATQEHPSSSSSSTPRDAWTRSTSNKSSQTSRSNSRTSRPTTLLSHKPLRTLEKLQHMLEETDYMTTSATAAAAAVPRTTTPPPLDRSKSSSDNENLSTRRNRQQQAPRQHDSLEQPEKLWTSKDRFKYKKQQLRWRQQPPNNKNDIAPPARTLSSSTSRKNHRWEPTAAGANNHKRLAVEVVTASTDDSDDGTDDDGLGYVLPDLPVYHSDDEGEITATNIDEMLPASTLPYPSSIPDSKLSVHRPHMQQQQQQQEIPALSRNTINHHRAEGPHQQMYPQMDPFSGASNNFHRGDMQSSRPGSITDPRYAESIAPNRYPEYYLPPQMTPDQHFHYLQQLQNHQQKQMPQHQPQQLPYQTFAAGSGSFDQRQQQSPHRYLPYSTAQRTGYALPYPYSQPYQSLPPYVTVPQKQLTTEAARNGTMETPSSEGTSSNLNSAGLSDVSRQGQQQRELSSFSRPLLPHHLSPGSRPFNVATYDHLHQLRDTASELSTTSLATKESKSTQGSTSSQSLMTPGALTTPIYDGLNVASSRIMLQHPNAAHQQVDLVNVSGSFPWNSFASINGPHALVPFLESPQPHSLSGVTSKLSFDSIQKLLLLVLTAGVFSYSAVSPRTLPLTEYNLQFYENIRIASLSIIAPAAYFMSVFDSRFNDVNTVVNSFFVSFTLGYVLTVAVEILVTTILRLVAFCLFEPDVFSLTPGVPIPILPWVLRDNHYRPKRITLFAADFATSCVACPIIEECVKLFLLQWSANLPKYVHEDIARDELFFSAH